MHWRLKVAFCYRHIASVHDISWRRKKKEKLDNFVCMYVLYFISSQTQLHNKENNKNTDRYAEGLPGQDGTNGNPDTIK